MGRRLGYDRSLEVEDRYLVEEVGEVERRKMEVGESGWGWKRERDREKEMCVQSAV